MTSRRWASLSLISVAQFCEPLPTLLLLLLVLLSLYEIPTHLPQHADRGVAHKFGPSLHTFRYSELIEVHLWKTDCLATKQYFINEPKLFLAARATSTASVAARAKVRNAA